MKRILLVILSASLLIACNDNPGYEITGKVNNADLDGKYVYLYEYGPNNEQPLDSSLVQNGNFNFKGDLQNPVLRTIRFSENDVKATNSPFGLNAPYRAVFVLENGKINVALDSISHASGTAENDAFKAYQQEVLSKQNELKKISQQMNSEDPAATAAAEKRYEEIMDQVNGAAKRYIQANKNRLTGGKLLYDFRYNLTEEERRDLLEGADATFVSAPGVPAIIDHLAVLKKVSIGEKFTDFEMADIKGEMHNLSEYVGNGKIVLIDFWASWCPPCRRDMPHLVETYKQYKNKGFEIVGISLDSSKEAWEKGITDLNITWPQLSDLKGWKNDGAAIYGVNSIPHVVLVDKDGTIIAKNLRNEKLDEKLREIFGS